jgi:uncharacterized CHY-type Zn-finger protein
MCQPTYLATGRCPYCGNPFESLQHWDTELLTCFECHGKFVARVTQTTEALRVQGEATNPARRRADLERAYA